MQKSSCLRYVLRIMSPSKIVTMADRKEKIVPVAKQKLVEDVNAYIDMYHIVDYEESKEEIIFIKPSMKVVEHVRKKYTCRHCDIAKMPSVIELPLSKSKASQSLLAEIILNKYSNIVNKDVHPDYSEPHVSDKITIIIQSFLNYINRKIWFKF